MRTTRKRMHGRKRRRSPILTKGSPIQAIQNEDLNEMNEEANLAAARAQNMESSGGGAFGSSNAMAKSLARQRAMKKRMEVSDEYYRRMA
jgi:hypothetical protein